MKKIIVLVPIFLFVSAAGCIGGFTDNTNTLVDEQFTVPANSTKNYDAELEAGEEVRISINVLKDEYLDFYIINPDGEKIISRSRVRETTITWIIPFSGTYRFTYDNSFSVISAKIVRSTITVTR
ncbi:MAG TPA: emp24/gp25L/p24 family protein [Candidatus Methanoperedens sp.]|nr:emp24/gp25L/p24 family protein [Candidatus Methanoperedens sp.]HLB71262.1 emp24/gp25L/p24 family protein [Candidatus Methanoperedens sp.]